MEHGAGVRRPEQRREFWELLLTRIQSKSVAEWNKVFDADPDVWAEVFRHGARCSSTRSSSTTGSVEIVDPERGPVRQLARLVRIGAWTQAPAAGCAPPGRLPT